MRNASTESRLRRALLTEAVRLREERQGYPDDTPAADAAARALGGTLVARIYQRAAARDDADTLRLGLAHCLQRARWLLGAILLAALLIGALAAGAVLGASDPVSLPLVLAVLVGSNLLSLVFWLLLQTGAIRLPAGLAAALRWLWQRLPQPKNDTASNTASGDTLRLLTGASTGRWVLASAVHLAWSAFSIGALLALAMLLSLRAFELGWQTTLLSPEALRTLADALSWLPQQLGLRDTTTLPLHGAMPDAAREAWAAWLLTAVATYGLLPRLFAALICMLAARHALLRSANDVQQPGYARLRARLLPEHGALQLVDGDEAAPTPKANAPMTVPALPAGRRLLLPVEWIPAPTVTAAEADTGTWLAPVDDPDSRRTALRALGEQPAELLVLVARAAATPGRGTTRLIRELCDAARMPAVLVLACGEDGVAEARRRDWQALARDSGVQLGVRAWPQGQPLSRILTVSTP